MTPTERVDAVMDRHASPSWRANREATALRDDMAKAIDEAVAEWMSSIKLPFNESVPANHK